MKGSSILLDLEKGKVEVDVIAEKARKDTTLIPILIEGVGSQKARIRFGSAKVLRRMSEMEPKLLYTYWDHFADRLSGENTFLRSDAMFVLANLAIVDSDRKFERIFERFYSQLNDKSMIPAANVAGNSGKLALAKPHLQTKIINRLIRIDDTDHGSECKNIIKGGVIDSFEEFYEEASRANKKKMLAFVRGETGNRRKSTRRKAERFMSRHCQTE
jgi:hypothetical protein